MPHTAINTHPMVVHAAYEAFRRLGAAEVRIAEGPGHRRGTLDLADAAGYFGTVPKFEDAFTDLNLDDVAKRVHPAAGIEPQVALSSAHGARLRSAGFAAEDENAPLGGRHAGDEESVRPGAGRRLRLAQERAALGRAFRSRSSTCIICFRASSPSSTESSEWKETGPIQGTPKHAGVLVAGSDVVAVDATCCRIMGINPQSIEYLTLARGVENLGESAFRQTGEPVGAVRSDFRLIDAWRHIRG